VTAGVVLRVPAEQVEGVGQQLDDRGEALGRPLGAAGQVDDERPAADAADPAREVGQRRDRPPRCPHRLGESRRLSLDDVERRLRGDVARTEPGAPGHGDQGHRRVVGERSQVPRDRGTIVGGDDPTHDLEAGGGQELADRRSRPVLAMAGGDPVARGDDGGGPALTASVHRDDLPVDPGTARGRAQPRTRAAGRTDERAAVAVIVLAAGAGTRYGGTKQLAVHAGRTLVGHAVTTALAAEVDRVVVVVGHDAAAVAAAARAAGPVEVVVNPDHDHGQATSLVAGIAALEPDRAVEVAVVLLADQPGVTPAAVRAVAAAVGPARGPSGARPEAARARYADGVGHPVAFRRTAWPRLRALSGDHGARHLLEDLAVAHVSVPGPVPADVDTPTDLEGLRPPADEG
jgi:molybdenum cofactor cytidylyltransferase